MARSQKYPPLPTGNTPTEQAYNELRLAYDFFNKRLFDGQLPPCLMTLQRKNRTYGYFSGERWADRSGNVTDEIALNPQHFLSRSVEEVLSTLAHEMVHLWQHHCGDPGRRAYHNREWADKMEAIGLMPSDTGQPGGKRTGEHMTHYVIEGGPFIQVCAVLIASGLGISWADRAGEGGTKGKKKPTRVKYTCPGCLLNAWAKPDVWLVCGECELPLEPQA